MMKNKFFNYSKNENIAKFSAELSPQDYYNSYLGMWYFCLVLTFLAQMLSLGSEYSYFSQVFSSSLSGALLILATVLFCLFIEASKYFVFGAFFKQMFLLTKSSINPFLLVLGILISGVSIYASVMGGGTFGIDTAKIVSTESKHDSEITTLRKEIAELHKRNTWKGNTYIQGKDKQLLHTKEAELSKAKQQKEGELKQVEAKNKESELTYRYWFGAFELVFVVCTWFVYYFKKRTTIECAKEVPLDSQDEKDVPTKIGFSAVPNSTIAPNSQKVGFQFGMNTFGQDTPKSGELANPTTLKVNGEGNNLESSGLPPNTLKVVEKEYIQLGTNERICKHCNSKFTFKHWNATYCGEKCKIDAWEKKTGKKFNKKKGGAK
ncbi:MAG: hypothetical protein MUE81_21935 [Thermoflexibacter sp.]|jgi:hypothetical protein|nr:hypothetical protein [Thermoflexibacter sp.]